MVEMGRQVSIATQWKRIASNPIILLHAIYDTFYFWLRSRNWRRMLLSIPIVATFAFFYFTVGSQSIQSDDRLAQQYSMAAQSQVATQTLTNAVLAKYDAKAKSTPNEQIVPSEKLQKLSVTLKRLLQLNPSDTYGLYAQALVTELNGDSERCQTILKAIAPDQNAGFAPAHAMIAAGLIAEFNAGKVEVRERLVHHLQEAIEWPDVDSRFLVAYSQIIENPKSRSRVIDLLKQAASRNPDFNLQLAFAARRFGFEGESRLAAEKALKHHEIKIGHNANSTEDWLALSKSHLLLSKFTEAKKLLKDALDNSQLDQKLVRRELSDTYRAEFYSTIKPDGNKSAAKFGLLESAAEADPSNPAVAEDISLLMSMEQQLSQSLLAFLKSHIDQNTATGATYFNVSNEYVKRNNFTEAIRYLELALKNNPASLEAQNNLGLLLARHHPEQISRSLELIEQAYSANPSNFEVIDSYGEILLVAKRPMEAIAKLTTSLNVNKSRVQTRMLLVRAYEEAGLSEMAQAHREALEQLKKK
jgi:tetratricopeptide (TPR) repeat protein